MGRKGNRMLTLFQFKTSPLCEKIRRVLHYKGVEYTLEEVPRAQVAEYAHVSPTGKFPAIEHDGKAVWDSTDIFHHLEAAFPQRPLLPASARDRGVAHVIEDWADESLYFYEITMRVSWEHNAEPTIREFMATMPGLEFDDAKAMVLAASGDLVSKQGLGRKPQEQVVSDVARHFDALDGMLDDGEWLVGDAITIADIAVASQLRVLLYAREAAELLESHASIKQWMQRVDEVAPK